MKKLYMIAKEETPCPLGPSADEDKILIDRPSYWGIFLKAVVCWLLRIETGYQFAEITWGKTAMLYDGRKLGMLYDDVLLINGDTFELHPWTLRTLIRFCWQGITSGTLIQAHRWRW